MKRRYSGYLLAVLLPLLLISGCTTLSPTGRTQFIMLNDQQLDQQGAQAFAQMRASEPVSSDQRTRQYVQCVTNALLAQTSDPYGWEIEVFESESPNAFALPGKKMGVYTGMLEVARTADQLAAVIGHEIGHVQARHGNERASAAMMTNLGLTAASLALGSSNDKDKQILGALGLGAQVGILLPFSRQHETEADLIGLDLMARAGFNPQASIELWENMRRRSQVAPLEFLSTHPGHNTRINTLQSAMPDALLTYQQARQRGITPRCTPPR